MDKRTISEEYAQVAADLIANEEALVDIANSQATIVYLSSWQKKKSEGKPVCALCERVPEKYKWGIPCDYTITVYEENVAYFTEEQIRILLFHELLHIKITFNEDGTETYGINPHDLSDFKLIVDRYGTDWANTEGGRTYGFDED